MERPVVVTVVSWYLIITTLLTSTNLILNSFFRFYNVEISSFLITIVVVLLGLIPAILMLKGKNIGRVIYIFGGIFSFGSSVYAANGAPQIMIGLVAPIILFIVFIILLYQPKSNSYFEGNSQNND